MANGLPVLFRVGKQVVRGVGGSLAEGKDGLRKLGRDRFQLGKGVLLVCLVCLVGVFFYDLLLAPPLEVKPLQAETPAAVATPAGEAAPRVLAYYTGAVGRKQLFTARVASAASGRAAPSEEDEIRKSLEKLELLGILLDDKPQAVVEDTEEAKTYFLYEGDTIRGAVVEKIMKGKIVLKYQERMFELVL